MATYSPSVVPFLLTVTLVGTASAADLTYDRDVRPILKAHCFHCHGEEGSPKGGLDLRLRRLLASGGDSGPAIQPGRPDDSLLLERVTSGEMPPGDKVLTTAETNVLASWIRQGAPAGAAEPDDLSGLEFSATERAFWFFQPPTSPQLPDNVAASPIDRFVHQRLAQHELTPSPQAAPTTLVRRLYFDLLGMPPTPTEVDQFLHDNSPSAIQRLVDRLLASPRYGERWGRHWLDVAGYADSEGYVDSDPVRPWAFRYRDYVIDAHNNDMPYDQFVVEQLAGDELVPPPYTNPTPEEIRRLTATGFLRMAPDGSGAAGAEPDVARNETIADTIKIVSTSLLGLTVGCARCHNHRYDPVSQQDYYQMRAIFAPALDWKAWRTPAQRQLSLYTAADRKLAAEIEAKAKQAEQERAAIINEHLKRTLYEELIKAPDALKETLKTAYQTPSSKRDTAQVALLKKYPNIGSISSGSLYLYSEQRARRAGEIEAVATSKEAALIAAVRSTGLAALKPNEQAALQAILAIAPAERTSPQQTHLSRYPRIAVTAETLGGHDAKGAALVKEYRQAAKRCRQLDAKKQIADLAAGVKQIRATIPQEPFLRALTEPPGHTPATFLFQRGNHSAPAADPLAPAELSILQTSIPVSLPLNDPSLPTTGRRLAYARHLTSGQHPLLARVAVNRIWYHHFGRGLVNTLGDFGQLGERPTHPQLLDWLAAEFASTGWSAKRLHGVIVSSETYLQQSARSQQLDTIDPDNRLYARQSIRRIATEVFRDAVLAVSGQYANRMAGPPVPVMEDAVGQIVLGQEDLDGERKPKTQADLGEAAQRRSVYIQVRRTRPLAVLETFDLATVAPNCTQRPSSNVAPQSLLLMNSDFIVGYAAAFAKRVADTHPADLSAQLTHAWQLAFAEPPSAETVARLVQFVSRQQVSAANGTPPAVPDLKALSAACQAILASNQFLYID
ncbi:MAG: PSD1 and planctomycete cytochrome C domain-containing protein [Planctomycetota bacterium]|nr:PSD1 and planctomycete cytochrome C domain-containing protein [Planctomycetota bacterium]